MNALKKLVEDFVKDEKPKRTWREVEERMRRDRDPRQIVSVPELRFLEEDDEAAR